MVRHLLATARSPAPLPVDVVTSTWDYIVGAADILAGLGAAGALLIAARAYSRQVEEASRQQATGIAITWGRFDRSREWDDTVLVSNGSDRPIRITRIEIFGLGPAEEIIEQKVPLSLQDGSMLPVVRKNEQSIYWAQVRVDFMDANGRGWWLTPDNALLRHGRLARLKSRLSWADQNE